MSISIHMSVAGELLLPTFQNVRLLLFAPVSSLASVVINWDIALTLRELKFRKGLEVVVRESLYREIRHMGAQVCQLSGCPSQLSMVRQIFIRCSFSLLNNSCRVTLVKKVKDLTGGHSSFWLERS